MTPPSSTDQITSSYIHTSVIPVRDYEVDCQGIVNNANYLHYLELTRHDFCQAAGLSFPEMHARGIDPVVRRIEIDYISSLTMGDTMLSCLRLSRRGARFVFTQHIYRASELAPIVRAEVTVACIEQGRLTRGDVLAEAFAAYI